MLRAPSFNLPRSARHLLSACAAIALLAAPALAQPAIRSYTIDSGGQVSTGGSLRLTSTIGQPEVGGNLTGGVLALRGGFLTPGTCTADFNGTNGATIDDLFLYINAYFQSSPAADINGVGGVTIDDLFLYINLYFVGC